MLYFHPTVWQMKGADEVCMVCLWSFWRQIEDSLSVLNIGSCELQMTSRHSHHKNGILKSDRLNACFQFSKPRIGFLKSDRVNGPLEWQSVIWLAGPTSHRVHDTFFQFHYIFNVIVYYRRIHRWEVGGGGGGGRRSYRRNHDFVISSVSELSVFANRCNYLSNAWTVWFYDCVTVIFELAFTDFKIK